jgi:hypothetical protein
MNDALEAQRERRPAMKKISTVVMEGIQIFKENQLTIGLVCTGAARFVIAMTSIACIGSGCDQCTAQTP